MTRSASFFALGDIADGIPVQRHRQHCLQRPCLCDDPIHYLGGAICHDGADGVRQPRTRCLCHGGRLHLRVPHEILRRAVSVIDRYLLRRGCPDQRRFRACALRTFLRRERARSGDADDRPGVYGRSTVHLHLGTAERAARGAFLSQGASRSWFSEIPDLSHVHYYRKRDHHSRVMVRSGTDPHRGADPRLSRQPPHGPVDRDRREQAVHPDLRVGQRARCDRRGVGGRDPRSHTDLCPGVPGLFSYRGRRGRPG